MSSTSNATVLGGGVISTGVDSISIAGHKPGGIFNPQADGVAIGNGIEMGAGSRSVAVGFDATIAATSDCVAIGSGSVAGAAATPYGVAIGRNASATGNSAVVVGQSSNSTAAGGIAIGSTASAGGSNGIAIGSFANSANTGSFQVSIGRNAAGSVTEAIAIGNGALASGLRAVALGSSTNASADDATCLGNGATNAVPLSIVLGRAANVNVRPGSDGVCDLGSSAARFKDLYFTGSIRNSLSAAGNYSTYGDTSVTNTVVETNISTNASSVGSLVLAAGQPLGMVLQVNLCLAASSVAGDSLTIRFKSNGNILWSHILTIPALAVNQPTSFLAKCTVRNGALAVCSVANQDGTSTMVVSSSIVYDRTVAQTWSITAEWGAALSTMVCGQLYLNSFFSG